MLFVSRVELNAVDRFTNRGQREGKRFSWPLQRQVILPARRSSSRRAVRNPTAANAVIDVLSRKPVEERLGQRGAACGRLILSRFHAFTAFEDEGGTTRKGGMKTQPLGLTSVIDVRYASEGPLNVWPISWRVFPKVDAKILAQGRTQRE